MKRTLYIIAIILFISCSSNRRLNENINYQSNQEININNHTENEKKVINDFLKEIKKKDRYKAYQNYELVIMEDSESRIGSIYTYKYCDDCKKIKGKKSPYQSCEFNKVKLDSLTISHKEKRYKWRRSDFKSKNLSLLNTEELRKSINQGNYTELPKRLLIYASVPLIFEEDKAYFYFKSGDSYSGFGVIEMATVIMEKNISGLWEINTLCFDPNITW